MLSVSRHHTNIVIPAAWRAMDWPIACCWDVVSHSLSTPHSVPPESSCWETKGEGLLKLDTDGESGKSQALKHVIERFWTDWRPYWKLRHEICSFLQSSWKGSYQSAVLKKCGHACSRVLAMLPTSGYSGRMSGRMPQAIPAFHDQGP